MKKNKKRAKKSSDIVNENPLYSPFDPQGSYTGVPKKGEKPVQDADDL